MFSPESCIQKLVPHVSIWIWRLLVTILNTGKFIFRSLVCTTRVLFFSFTLLTGGLSGVSLHTPDPQSG